MINNTLQQPAPGLLPVTPQSSLTKQGFAQANNSGTVAGAITPSTLNPQLGQGTPGLVDTNPYSYKNYYAAHPDANPANNNTGGIQGVLPPPSSSSVYGGGTSTNNAQTGGLIAPPQTQGTGTPGLAPPPNPQNSPYTNTGAPGFSSTVGSLASTASQPSRAFTDAQAQAKQALSDLNTSRQNEAQQLALNNSNPIPLEFQQGRGQVLQSQYLSQQDAYAQQYAGATAQENAATGQQSAQQNGLGQAASLSAPQLGQYGQPYYNPLDTNQSGASGGGALNPINNIQSIAQQVVSGQISPSQANAMGGNIANFQGALNQAILGLKPGYNAAQAQGAYDAKQSNTTTSGTAPTNAASSAYQTLYPQLLQLQNTTSNVDQFGNLLLNTMKDPSGNTINPSDLKYANQTLSQIRNQLSSSQQATFDSTFASLKSRVSGLLAQGGSEIPSQITSDANKIIDGSLPFSSLSAVLQRITTEGNILTSNLQNQLNTAGSTIGAPKAGSSSNPLNI